MKKESSGIWIRIQWLERISAGIKGIRRTGIWEDIISFRSTEESRNGTGNTKTGNGLSKVFRLQQKCLGHAKIWILSSSEWQKGKGVTVKCKRKHQ